MATPVMRGRGGLQDRECRPACADHPQLVDLGFLDFWQNQQDTGYKHLFPKWTQHVKGGKDNRPEVHFEATSSTPTASNGVLHRTARPS
jgi:hypothetical protein